MEAASTAPRETHCTQLSRNSRPSMSYREGERQKEVTVWSSETLRNKVQRWRRWFRVVRAEGCDSESILRSELYCYSMGLSYYSPLSIASLSFPPFHPPGTAYASSLWHRGEVWHCANGRKSRHREMIWRHSPFFIFYVHNFLTCSVVTKEILSFFFFFFKWLFTSDWLLS